MANHMASISSETNHDSKPIMGFSEAEFEALRSLLQNSGSSSRVHITTGPMHGSSSSSPIEETRG
ncbi:hypothetical protein A2U01_0063154, partial [Trifolium medium]|nr:hypothetical protein [Trifolium medium]